MNTLEHSIPEQTAGIKKEFAFSRKFTTLADAQLCYATAISRLININHWDDLSPAKKGGFQLMSSSLKPQHRRAKVNDYVRIGIPGPDNPEGAGYDWVKVVTLKFLTGKHKEQYLLTLQPCPMPGASHTAHFFSGASTSSFLLTRTHRVVTAAYYGHNEMPNTDTEGVVDAVRNVAVAAGALVGFSDILWAPLTRHLIADGTKLRALAKG